MRRFSVGAMLVAGAVAAAQLLLWAPPSLALTQPSQGTVGQVRTALVEATRSSMSQAVRARVIDGDMVRNGGSLRAKPIKSPKTLTLNFVLLVEDGQARRPVTSQEQDQIQDVVRVVDEYYNGLSGGKIRVALGDVTGWTNAQGCDSELVDSGAFSELTRKPNHHVVMVKQCGFMAGMAQRPGKRIWMQAYSKYDPLGKPLALAPDVLAHEFGHNLGAGHAQTESCVTLFFKMKCPSSELKDRVIDEYGDGFDLMGSARGGEPLAGPMNPIMSAQIGLPYRTTVVNLRSLKGPRSVTIQPRTASPSEVRALRLKIGGVDVHFSLAPNGLLDTYGGGAQAESGSGLPTLLAHGTLGESSVLLKVIHAAAGSGVVEGLSYRLDGGVVLQVDEVSERQAVLTFTPSPRTAATGRLVGTEKGLVAKWAAVSDERVTGYRIRLLGEKPCELNDYGSVNPYCLFEESSREPVAVKVDADKSTNEYEFSGLNPGQTYAVQVVPLTGDQEGIGLLSPPVRAMAGLPKVDLVASRSAITLRGTTPAVDFANVDYRIDCTRGQWWIGSRGSSTFPISITVASGCVPTIARLSVSGAFEDGRLFELPPTKLQFP